MASSLGRTGGALLCSWLFLVALAAGQKTSPKVNGNENQSVGKNYGWMIQNNVIVNNPVRSILQRRAKSDGDEQGWFRLLTPANDPPPRTGCEPFDEAARLQNPKEVPVNPLVIMLGTFVGRCAGDDCPILQDRGAAAAVKNLLSVVRRGHSLLVSAAVFDQDGKIIVSIENNRPHVNKNNVFGWKRPDAHTLEVTDQRDRTVLYIRFVNSSTVYVQGIFYNEAGSKARVDEDGIHIDTTMIHDFVYRNSCVTVLGHGSGFAF